MNERPIASIARTREILNTHGLRAKKNFGQNFLVDVSVVARAAQASHCEQAVIEIGPGIGSLTEQLALRSRHVRCYEVDERLLPVLKEELAGYDNVEIILQDFLECDLEKSVQELTETWGGVSVCANLPYYVTSPILFRLFEGPEEIEYITVMIQKEVADRFSAAPGSPEYGALSAEAQYLYEVKKLFNVPKTAFSPAPKVDSAIVQFHRKQNVHADAMFFKLIRACFQQRRKTLYNNLRETAGDGEKTAAWIERAGLPLGIRAQEMDLTMFEALYRTREGVF
ncbi:MAG: ribosomal RNA small subunit methyltransferase A [Solobacterium sp.]|nr:ribosomal RNA small subunit methyltransferase A [Solobacterium sp.]